MNGFFLGNIVFPMVSNVFLSNRYLMIPDSMPSKKNNFIFSNQVEGLKMESTLPAVSPPRMISSVLFSTETMVSPK